jgi:hypothetical protein
MKKIFSVLVGLLMLNIAAKAQDEFLNDLINLWNNKKFDKVYLPLKEYKDSKKISGDFEIDYMIASSASRSNGNAADVKTLFDDLSKNYTFKTEDEEFIKTQATPAKYEHGKNARMDAEYIANRGKAGDKTSKEVPHPLGKVDLQKIEAQKIAQQKKAEAQQLADQKKKEAAEKAAQKKAADDAKKAAAKAKLDSLAAAKDKTVAPTDSSKTETDEVKDYNNPAKDTKAFAAKSSDKTKTAVAKKDDGKKVMTTKDKMTAAMADKAGAATKNSSDIIRKPNVTQIIKGDRTITVKAGYTYIVRTDSIFEMPPPAAKKPMGAVATPVKK